MRTAAIFLAALVFVPTASDAAVARRARYLMGTVCEVAVSPAHESDIERAFAEAARVESVLSTWRADSELSRLNRGEGPPSSELSALLHVASRWAVRTDRAFDPRIGRLIDVWKTRAVGALPSSEEIANAMSASPQWEEGAFGKGYAIDRMLAQIDGPEAMIDFGGQIAVRGSLRVSIADPSDRQHPVVALTIENASLSTSSGSEKTFEVEGRRFSHILDPRSGLALPPRGSASVIASDALTADILSTALYVMGEEDGLRWAGANGVAAVFISPDNRISFSEAARGRVRRIEVLDHNFKLKE
jgi:FAD:protein FMN transferase